MLIDEVRIREAVEGGMITKRPLASSTQDSITHLEHSTVPNSALFEVKYSLVPGISRVVLHTCQC